MRNLLVGGVILGVGVGVGLGAGCGSGGKGGAAGAKIDCAWAAGDNCWKTTTALAAACVPPSTESGTLNAGDTVCTYTSGATVTFNVPLMTTALQPTYDFSVTGPNGQPCLTFKSTANGGFTLDVGGQTLTSAASQTGFTLTCPDGTKYDGKVADLASCGGASLFDVLPSFGFSSGQTYDFSLTGTGDPSATLKVFSCAAGNDGTNPRYNDCAITGGTGSFPPNLCVDFTGSGNTGFDGNAEALSECDALVATCGSGCLNIFSALSACSVTNGGQAIIGTCVVSGGQPLEQSVTFYAPTTSEQAQTYCAGLNGVYTAG